MLCTLPQPVDTKSSPTDNRARSRAAGLALSRTESARALTAFSVLADIANSPWASLIATFMSLLCAARSSVTSRHGLLLLLALSPPILPGCGSQRAAPKSAGFGPDSAPIAYEVRVGPNLDLAIEMTVPGAAGLGTLSVDRPEMPY